MGAVLHEMMSNLFRGLVVEMLDLLLPQLCEDTEVTAMVRARGYVGLQKRYFRGMAG